MREWPTPRTIKELRGFWGLTGYYRRCAQNYGLLSKPLTNLLKKILFIGMRKLKRLFRLLKLL